MRTKFCTQNLKGSDSFIDLGMDGKIMLKWILKVIGCGLHRTSQGMSTNVRLFMKRMVMNGHVSLKVEKSLDQLSDLQLVRILFQAACYVRMNVGVKHAVVGRTHKNSFLVVQMSNLTYLVLLMLF
jgi:hypothetical protein